MVTDDTINGHAEGRHERISIIQVVDDLGLVDEPHCTLDDIASEDGKGSVRDERLDGVVHALLEAAGTVALRIAILAGWELSLSGSIGSGVGPTANVLGAVVVGANLVGEIDVDIAVMDNLERSLATGGWSRSTGWLG